MFLHKCWNGINEIQFECIPELIKLRDLTRQSSTKSIKWSQFSKTNIFVYVLSSKGHIMPCRAPCNFFVYQTEIFQISSGKPAVRFYNKKCGVTLSVILSTGSWLEFSTKLCKKLVYKPIFWLTRNMRRRL